VSREHFIVELSAELQDELCHADDTHFRSCFEVDEATCRAQVAVAFETCREQHKVPARVADADHASQIGVTLGGCTGARYSEHFSNQGRASQESRCRNVAAWIR